MVVSSLKNVNQDFKIVGSALEAHSEMKRALEVPPISKRMGAAFTTISAFGTKVAVRKVINMMDLTSLSPKTIARIARGAVSLEQYYYYHSHGWSNRYRVRVTYPNGYGASITCDSELCESYDETDIWEVALTEDGELYKDTEGRDYIWSGLTEEDVVTLCDRIYFFE